MKNRELANLLSRVRSFFSGKGHGGNSTSADPTPSTSIGPLMPHDPSTHFLPQHPISQLSNQTAMKETKPVKSLHSKAGATHLAASSSADPTPNTSIAPLTPHDPSTHSLPHDPISLLSNHTATNETKPVKSEQVAPETEHFEI